MSATALHSIRPLDVDDNALRGWRIASALAPVAIAELTVKREETREVSPARVLLLETVRLLEKERGSANVSELAKLTGVCDETLMARILVPLAEQELLLIEGECVRQNPALTIERNQARIVMERDEQVCVIGSPLVPILGIDLQPLKKLCPFDADGASVDVDAATLENWRGAFWNSSTHALKLREPLQPRQYVLEGRAAAGKYVLYLCDESVNVRVTFAVEHPFIKQLLVKVDPILDHATELLKPFGTWNAAKYELNCTGEQWGRWCTEQGSDHSEIILRGAVDIGMTVFCRPADTEAARAMLLENVLAELDDSYGQCTTEHVERVADRERRGHLLQGHDLPTPTLTEVEAAAWESGRWELAYRIAGPADRL